MGEDKPRKDNESDNKPPQPDLVKGLNELVPVLTPLVDRYIEWQNQKEEIRNKRLLLISKHNRNFAIILLVFLAAVIAIMSYLTFVGKVSGDALLFLVGTITGYILFSVESLVIPMYSEGDESD